MSRNPIQDHFVILCSKLNLDKILPYLKQERMVTTDEYEMLTSPNFTTRQKREKLLIWLPRKGRNYFTNFGKCLVWSGQTELARHIGVNVALVPDPPFLVPEEEPSPDVRQNQIVGFLRDLMNSSQPPIPVPVPKPLVNGGGVPHALSKAQQPASNTREHIFLPGQRADNQAPASLYPQAPEPMDLSAPLPQNLRQDRHVLRASTANQPEGETKGKVFILYCKDDQLPPTFSDEVLDLADTLNSCGGFECVVDRYVAVPPPNWNNWTLQRIQASQYVILVYSPTLARVIKSPQANMVNMEKGKYYANGIINLMHPPKFIPVYLNGHRPAINQGWLPPQLHTSTEYDLNISQLGVAIEVPEESPPQLFYDKLTNALHDDRFKEVAKLVSHLRGESDTVAPIPPPNPIKIPPAIVHNPSQIAHPQSQVQQPSRIAHPQSQVQQLSRIAHPQSQLNHLSSVESVDHPHSQVHQPSSPDIHHRQSQDVHPQLHVAHPQSQDHPVSLSACPQLQAPPVACLRSQVHQPPPVARQSQVNQVPSVAHPWSGLQREPHVAHPQSEVQLRLNGTHPQSAMQHSGMEEESVQSYQNNSCNIGAPIQSMTDYETKRIRDDTMMNIGVKVKNDWYRLGEYLGVDKGELDYIQQDVGNPPDYQVATLRMFNAWQVAKGELATRKVLKGALNRLNYGHVAQEYFQDV